MKPSEKFLGLSVLSWLLGTSTALADEALAKVDSGDTAWLLISTGLVLLMTPGLAFFYGGMVRTKNVLSTLFQNVSTLTVAGLVWCLLGYSLAFSGDFRGLVGNLNWFMLNGVGQAPNPDYAATIPHLLFMLFQAMFAIISPALISGAVAERFSFKSWLVFTGVWSLLVYAPVAHWVWGVGGWIREFGGLDFAGGLVVHITAGYSALVAALMLGKRRDFGSAEIRPYDAGFIVLGTALLWFGWFGFNGGSALGANGLAAQAVVTTFIAAAAAGFTWSLVDNFVKNKPSAVGACIGAVAGLVAITPASGFVGVGHALLIGAIAGAVCNYMAILIKEKFQLDDTLDVFACHGIGGTIGSILTPVFASKAINAAGADGLIFGNFAPLKGSLVGTAAVIAFSMIMTVVIIKVLSLFMNVRVSHEEEEIGLDHTQHGEVINSEVVPLKERKGKYHAA